MKYLLKLGMVFLTLLFVVSCNNSKKKKTENIENILSEQMNSYTIDTAGVSVLWTAYKFTDKFGVSGKFDNFKLSTVSDAESIKKLLKKSEIVIYTESVNSNSEIRDPKLRASFFKVFNTDTIRGIITESNQGKGLLDLEMNDITKSLDYNYSIKSDTLFLFTKINLEKWEGGAAMQSLNKECYDLHMGADGISKLWPDVDIMIKLPIRNKTIP
jgi:polyisoprenoid-binding protein YceI